MARSRRLQWFLAEWVGSRVWGILYRTLRLEVHGDEQLEALEEQYGAMAFASWHYEMLPTLYHHRHCGGCTFTGEHADAELVARAVRRIGYTPVRGSTTHGGIRGLIELIRAMRHGRGVGFTPDGPRGPRCIAQVGIAILGQRSGCPIVPMGFASDWFWQFRSWDRMRIPKPFSKSVICYGEAIHVPFKLTPEELEVWRKRIEDAITAESRRAEGLLGLPPERSAFAECEDRCDQGRHRPLRGLRPEPRRGRRAAGARPDRRVGPRGPARPESPAQAQPLARRAP